MRRRSGREGSEQAGASGDGESPPQQTAPAQFPAEEAASGSPTDAAGGSRLPGTGGRRHTRFRRDAASILLFILRAAFFFIPPALLPLSLNQVLDCDAHAGILGYAQDLLRIAWGSRLAALLGLPLLLPLPLHLHLLAQVCGCVLLMRAAPALCSTRLMEHPLTGERIAEFNSLLAALSQPLGTWSLALVVILEENKLYRGCKVVIGFLSFTLGILLSTALLVKMRPTREEGGGWLSATSARAERSIHGFLRGSWMTPQADTDDEPVPAVAEAAGGGMPGWRMRAVSCWLVLCAAWALAVAVMAAAQELKTRRQL